MNEKKATRLENIKQIRVLSDPYRQEILSHLGLLRIPSTAKEIAQSMGEPPSKINYHIKVLENYNFVDIDHTENINGIIAKYYKVAVKNYDFSGKESRTKEKDAAIVNMINNMYDNAKQNYISKVVKTVEANSKKEEAQLLSGKLYLNKEDIEEINLLLERMFKNNKEGREIYSSFFSLVCDD